MVEMSFRWISEIGRVLARFGVWNDKRFVRTLATFHSYDALHRYRVSHPLITIFSVVGAFYCSFQILEEKSHSADTNWRCSPCKAFFVSWNKRRFKRKSLLWEIWHLQVLSSYPGTYFRFRTCDGIIDWVRMLLADSSEVTMYLPI